MGLFERLAAACSANAFPLIFLACVAVYSIARMPNTIFNEHIRLAWAMVHGHLYVDGFVPWEHVVVNGHSYILHPPLSAFVALPFTAIWGLDTNQVSLALFIGALGTMLAYRLTSSLWLTAFFAFGTIFGYEATQGASWGFCLVLSCIPTLLALTEVFGKRRALLVGLWAALAALARYDLVLIWPVYALLLTERRDWLKLLPGFALAGIAYVWFNEARFGTLTDISIPLWFTTDAYARSRALWGPFSIHYLPMNLYTAFAMLPAFKPSFPYWQPHVMGQAILLTSPAFLLALRAPLRAKETWLLWAAVILGMAAALNVYANGFVQFGARYWIQVYPFLLALMWRGWRNDRWSKVLIVLSIVIVALGTWQIRTVGFANV